MKKNSLSFVENLALTIENFIVEYNSSHFEINLWRKPILGVADAADTEFEKLSKEIIPGHFMPSDILESAKRVVVIFVPFTQEVIDSNTGGEFSSKLWDQAYDITNEMLAALNKYLCEYLMRQGFKSTGDIPSSEGDEEQRAVTSCWSHRHVGVIAGLGTFGINNMIITEKGCAGRLLSFVTEAELPVTPKMEEQCLAKRNGSCMQCIKSCPMNAISMTEQGFYVDKEKCVYQIYDKKRLTAPMILGGANCGKCSCGVDCSVR